MSVWSATALLLSLLYLWLTTALAAEPGCEVHFPSEGSRQLQWPPHLMVPVTSKAVYLDCSLTLSADASNRKPYWAVGLSGDAVETHLQFNTRQSQLNEFGVYELPAIETPGTHTLRLLVNDIARNNGTMVFCVGVNSESYQTTLMMYDPTHVQYSLETLDIDMASVTLSWSPMVYPIRTPTDTPHNYSLIIHSRSGDYVAVLDVEGYTFTAPKDAPPCEVYNFSVTATYVGATYTGAGCSVPSPVLSKLLPASLPDIDTLESSLTYFLTIQSNEGITLSTSFKQPTMCPVYNYSLIVHDSESLNGSTFQRIVSLTEMRPGNLHAKDLPENTKLTFKIAVSNGISEALSNGTEFYTTDVQHVKAASGTSDTTSSTAITVQCLFIDGSSALGCEVLLVTQDHGNITVDLTREGTCAETTLTLDKPGPVALINVFGVDVESDGEVGVTAVQGEVTTMDNFRTLCLRDGPLSPMPPTQDLNIETLIGLISCITVVVVLAAALFIVIIVVCRFKRPMTKLSPTKHSSDMEKDTDNSYSQEMPFYDLPENLTPSIKSNSLVRMSVNGTSYTKTCHSIQVSPVPPQANTESATYATVEEREQHLYHVLEEGKTPPHEVVVISSDTDSPDLNTSARGDCEHLYHVLEAGEAPSPHTPDHPPPITTPTPHPPPIRTYTPHPPPTTTPPLPPPPTTTPPPPPITTPTDMLQAVYQEVTQRSATTTPQHKWRETTPHSQIGLLHSHSFPSSSLSRVPQSPIYQDVRDLSLPRTRRAVQPINTRLRSHSTSTIMRTVV